MRSLNLPKINSNSRINRYSESEVLVAEQPIRIPIKSLVNSSVEWVELKGKGELDLKQSNSDTMLPVSTSFPITEIADSLILQANTYSERLNDRLLEINFLNAKKQRIATYNLSFTVLRICLDVDADRDGIVEENHPHKADWKAGKEGYGAITLVNSDQDVSSERREPNYEDYRLNGLLDIKDCSLMVVRHVGPDRLPSGCDLRVWVTEKNLPLSSYFR